MAEDQYELHMTRGPASGQTFALGNHNLTIGRDSLSDIVVGHPEISRQHALIIIDRSGAYQIQDLGSTNGTFLDGNRLDNNPRVLRPSQTLTLGSAVTFIYRRREIDASAASAEAALPELEAQPEVENVEKAVEIEEQAVAVQRSIEKVVASEEAEQEVLIAQTPLRAQRVNPPRPASSIDSQRSTPTVPGPNLVLGIVLLLLCCSASLLLFILLLGGDWLFRLAGFVP